MPLKSVIFGKSNKSSCGSSPSTLRLLQSHTFQSHFKKTSKLLYSFYLVFIHTHSGRPALSKNTLNALNFKLLILTHSCSHVSQLFVIYITMGTTTSSYELKSNLNFQSRQNFIISWQHPLTSVLRLLLISHYLTDQRV